MFFLTHEAKEFSLGRVRKEPWLVGTEKDMGNVEIQSIGAEVKLGKMNFLTVYNTVK